MNELRVMRWFLAVGLAGVMQSRAASQPTLLDDYDGTGDLTYTTEYSGSAYWQITGGHYRGKTGNDVLPEHSYASYDLTASIPAWELNKAKLNCWCGWMDLNRAIVSGWSANYSCGMVLAANSSDLNETTTQGYAVGFRDGGTPADELVIFRFSQGIRDGSTSLPPGATEVVTSGYQYLDGDDGVNFYVELLSDGRWKIYYKKGAALSAADAIDKTKYTDGSATSAAADETYAGVSYRYAGWIYAHNSGSSDFAKFDNFGAGQDMGYADEPANHATNFDVDRVTTRSLRLTWTGSTGSPLPDSYLIVGKKGSGTYASVADGTAVADDMNWGNDNAAINATHATGANAYTFTGLVAATTYSFKIYPYKGSGSTINFKTDGTAPSLSAMTATGSVTILQESFETDGNGTRYVATNHVAADPNDYFKRGQDGDFSMVSLDGEDGVYYYGGEDTDGSSGPGECAVVLNALDVSGYTNLRVRISVAASSTNAFETTDDYLYVDSRFDAAAWTKIGAFEAEAGTAANRRLRQDTDLNGVGEGTIISNRFQDFEFTPAGTGTGLQIRVRFFMNAGDEESAFDNIRIIGDDVSSNQKPTIAFNPAGASKIALTSRAFSFTVRALEPPNDAADTISLWATNLPPGATFGKVTGIYPLTNAFHWTPGTYQSDNYSVTFYAADKDGTNSATVQIAARILDDDFEDGDLTDWTQGTAGDWVNSTTTPITGSRSMKHNVSGVSRTSYVYAQPVYHVKTNNTTWRLNLKNGGWDPSLDNNFSVYLMANDNNLGGSTVDGYAVGVNLTGSDDFLKLWRVTDGAVVSTVVTSALDWGSANLVGVEVSRTVEGVWSLKYDANGGFDNLVYAGSNSDTTHTNSTRFGLFFEFTSSYAGSLWWDDVSIYQGGGPANVPPSIALTPALTNRTVATGTPLPMTVVASEVFNDQSDRITLSASGLPSGATFPTLSGPRALTNAFLWTPGESQAGNYTVTFTASDKDGSTALPVHVRVVNKLDGSVWINEIHYDDAGADENEGVEIAGAAGTDLSGYSLFLYNGAFNKLYDSSYRTDLTGIIDNESRGYGALWFGFPVNGLENGNATGTEPDAIALVRIQGSTTNVLQMISYEGSFCATNGPARGWQSENIGVKEDLPVPAEGLSLQLTGFGATYRDYHWIGPAAHSRDTLNAGQTIPPRGTFFQF